MSETRKYLLFALVGVLLIDVFILIFGVYSGHEGLFNFGAEVGKVIFGTVVGALATAFTGSDSK